MNTVTQLSPANRGPCDFTRLAASLARHKGDFMAVAADVADSKPLSLVMKAAVASGTTSDANWAHELTDFAKLSGEFAARLRPSTVIGRLRGLRYVPPATRTLKEASGATGAWVGEGAPAPVSQFDADEISVGVSKMQSLIVITSELARTGNPAALATLEQLMIKSLTEAQDKAFIDSTIAFSSAGPASVTYASVKHQSTGATAAAAAADLKAMVQQLISAGSDLTAATWVLHPRSALALGTMLNAGNQLAFPGIGPLGGTLLGLPAITSAAIPTDTGDDTYAHLIDASRILIADEGMAAVDVSRQSSLQLLNDPSTGAQNLVSMWSNGLVGIRLTRWIGWQVLDGTAIATLEDVAY